MSVGLAYSPPLFGLPNERLINSRPRGKEVYTCEPKPGVGASVYLSAGRDEHDYWIVRAFPLNGQSPREAYEHLRDGLKFDGAIAAYTGTSLQALCLIHHLAETLVTTGGNHYETRAMPDHAAARETVE